MTTRQTHSVLRAVTEKQRPQGALGRGYSSELSGDASFRMFGADSLGQMFCGRAGGSAGFVQFTFSLKCTSHLKIGEADVPAERFGPKGRLEEA
jgi:hypothetical protein